MTATACSRASTPIFTKGISTSSSGIRAQANRHATSNAYTQIPSLSLSLSLSSFLNTSLPRIPIIPHDQSTHRKVNYLWRQWPNHRDSIEYVRLPQSSDCLPLSALESSDMCISALRTCGGAFHHITVHYVTWHGMARRGEARRGVARRGVAWPGGLPWPGLAWPGLAWPGLAWPGLARRGVAWCEVAWRRVAWPGEARRDVE